jgi:hypothetical protein
MRQRLPRVQRRYSATLHALGLKADTSRASQPRRITQDQDEEGMALLTPFPAHLVPAGDQTAGRFGNANRLTSFSARAL